MSTKIMFLLIISKQNDNYLFRDGDLHVLSEDCRAALSVAYYAQDTSLRR